MVPKLQRLMNLVATLLDTPKPLSADEIHIRVEGYSESLVAFRRSFERDKDDLRSMGIPIVIEPVPGSDPPVDGYRVHRRDYEARNSSLEPDELAALHLAASLVEVEGLDDEAFWKLGGAAGTESAAEAPRLSLPSDPNLGELFDAARARSWVQFDYQGTRRHVLPRRLTFTNGRWYLSAWDAARLDNRLFRVDRIRAAVSGAPTGPEPEFDAPTELRLKPWELGDDEPVPARILVDADQAAWARHEAGGDASIADRDDGSIVIELQVRNRDGLRSFVLSYLEHAEVLSPPELRAEVADWLRASLAAIEA